MAASTWDEPLRGDEDRTWQARTQRTASSVTGRCANRWPDITDGVTYSFSGTTVTMADGR